MLIRVVCFIFTILACTTAQRLSVQADKQPVTFRLDACTGGSKGYSCLTKPSDCKNIDACELVAAWIPTATGVEFTLIGGKTTDQAYVAIGFGDSTELDGSKHTICSYLDTGEISAYNSYNDGDDSSALSGADATAGISHVHGQYTNERLYCRFERAVKPGGSSKVARLDEKTYVFLGSGPMSGSRKHGKYYSPPVVSGAQDVSKPSTTGRVTAADPGAKTRPLLKAHGILMIIAWILLVLAATLQPRYYRFMWPNNRPCGSPVWFAIHMPLMFLATGIFTIAFILVLIASDGKYREPPELPQRAHPILGLIALIFGWINPIISFFRCKPGAHYRPIFNWIHFIIGTIAVVFAVVNCFIGLSFTSVRAPAWTAYVLVAVVVFHLIVEILLELAGCFYYAKNKEKQEQYELRQQALSTGEDPEPYLVKPKPAGRVFKNVVLALHSFIMTALVLAIVIGIALN